MTSVTVEMSMTPGKEKRFENRMKTVKETIKGFQSESLPPALQQLMKRCNEQELTKLQDYWTAGKCITRTFCTLCNIMSNKHPDNCKERCAMIIYGRNPSNLLEIAKKSDADQAEFITRVEGALRG